ncbi:MAG: DNA polymerase III subunit delta [Cytophagales bacterium]|nr:DNA polymerase III subunit delta [Cytophagales bacterium]
MRFSEIRGLSEIKGTLIHSIQSGHVASAQLFFGREGSANLALALAYATYLNCENPGETDACGECGSCSKALKFVHPDIHFVFPYRSLRKEGSDHIDEKMKSTALVEWRLFVKENPYGTLKDWLNFAGAENKQFFISVDESRYLSKLISLKSFEGRYKIVLIWLPELMRVEAANALLKLLEEPPAKTVFLLMTNSIENILLTIQSRTQLVRVPSFSQADVIAELSEKHQLEEKKAIQIAKLVDGNMNEALRMVFEIEDDNHKLFRDWMLNCFRRDGIGLVKTADTFATLGREAQKNFFNYGLSVLRECLAFKSGNKDVIKHGESEADFISKFSNFLTTENLPEMASILNQSGYYIERNANAKIIWMDASMKISGMLKR